MYPEFLALLPTPPTTTTPPHRLHASGNTSCHIASYAPLLSIKDFHLSTVLCTERFLTDCFNHAFSKHREQWTTACATNRSAEGACDLIVARSSSPTNKPGIGVVSCSSRKTAPTS
jgi:hypothetical protein